MDLLRKCELGDGYTQIVKPWEGGIELIEFGILKLSGKNELSESSQGNEVVLVVLSGACTVRAGSTTFSAIGARPSVFAGKPHSVYIPCQTDYRISADEKAEVAIIKAPSDVQGKAILIPPKDVVERDVGQHNWKRHIYDIVDTRISARRLVVGETFNPPGCWSSYPPHRHDNDNLPEESEQEEVYFFKIDPPQGFGVQRIYTDDRSLDEAYIIEDNSTVAIPQGYHPVVAGPGYRLYYLWILAGEKRVLKPKDDPAHAWLKNCEPIIAGL